MTNGAGGAARAFKLYGLLAETFIHAGVGRARGGIDLPVARESTTDYPYIAGSSGKGAARDAFRRHWFKPKGAGPETDATDAEKILFGPDTGGAAEGAGELIFSDMRLLLLPVRSLTSACRYLTCPELIYRLVADLRRAGYAAGALDQLAEAARSLVPADDKTAISMNHGTSLYLEELCLVGVPSPEVKKLADCAKLLLPDGSGMATALEKRLTIVSDDAFSWFAGNALPTRMRNALDEKKKVRDGALWSEEYLAPDTLMYMLIGTRGDPTRSVSLPGAVTPCAVSDAFDMLTKADKDYFQVGGNETVGHGWFHVHRFAIAAAPGLTGDAGGRT